MERNKSLDIVKCIAVISVIIYHITEITGNYILKSFINTYFLSIFFFVSGYLINKNKISLEWIRRKFVYLIIPFFVGATCYQLFEGVVEKNEINTVFLFLFDDAKGGYWFLFVLFFFFCILAIILKVENVCKSVFLKFIVLTIPFFIATISSFIFPNFICSTLSIYSFRRYWLLFIFGYLIKNYSKMGIENPNIGRISLALYIPLSIFYSFTIQELQSNLDFLFWLLVNVLSIYAWLFISHVCEAKLNLKKMTMIGTNTLGIYVFQFYPVLLCKHFSIPLVGGLSCFLYTLVVTIFCLSIAFLMVCFCKKNRYISLLFLGNYQK